MDEELDGLVIECGSSWTKVGFTQDDFPHSIFETVVSKHDKVYFRA